MTICTNSIKNSLGFLIIMGAMMLFFPLATVHAAQKSLNAGDGGRSCDARFLTFPAWYRGLVKPGPNGSCDIKSPSELDGTDGKGGFTKFIWTIVLNLVEIMLQLVGYAAVGFILYGGVKYIYSAGSPDKMVSARKTILNAVIGLIISIISVAIVNTVAGGLK